MLTPAQLATLKAAILADATLSAFPNTADGNFEVAALLNLEASPAFWVWRPFVPEAEIYEVTTQDATTWDWTVFIAQSLQEQGAWRQMVSMRGGMNPSLANVRAGVAKIFAGTAAGPVAQRLHLLTIARRKATGAEKALATGTGTTAAPATAGFAGSLSYTDVTQARNLA